MITLHQTCHAFPEQYDAVRDGERVGYLRLRWSEFRVHCPDSRGIVMFEGVPKGDGEFDDDERDHYLRQAVRAILIWLDGIDVPLEEVVYEVRTGEPVPEEERIS